MNCSFLFLRFLIAMLAFFELFLFFDHRGFLHLGFSSFHGMGTNFCTRLLCDLLTGSCLNVFFQTHELLRYMHFLMLLEPFQASFSCVKFSVFCTEELSFAFSCGWRSNVGSSNSSYFVAVLSGTVSFFGSIRVLRLAHVRVQIARLSLRISPSRIQLRVHV